MVECDASGLGVLAAVGAIKDEPDSLPYITKWTKWIDGYYGQSVPIQSTGMIACMRQHHISHRAKWWVTGDRNVDLRKAALCNLESPDVDFEFTQGRNRHGMPWPQYKEKLWTPRRQHAWQRC